MYDHEQEWRSSYCPPRLTLLAFLVMVIPDLQFTLQCSPIHRRHSESSTQFDEFTMAIVNPEGQPEKMY